MSRRKHALAPCRMVRKECKTVCKHGLNAQPGSRQAGIGDKLRCPSNSISDVRGAGVLGQSECMRNLCMQGRKLSKGKRVSTQASL